MLRTLVRGLARFCGFLAAVFLAAIAVATLTQIVARQMALPVETTELSGFFLAASTFLALAYTFINGGHVRIGLVAQFAPPRLRRVMEVWICAVAAFVVGYAAWHMTAFTLETYRFGDLSPGMMGVPLWIPQSGVSIGLIVLWLAILEQATLVLRGRPAGYETNIDSTAE
jgi:TRAP-type C4-dicarboxylate transport system permease small subunit